MTDYFAPLGNHTQLIAFSTTSKPEPIAVPDPAPSPRMSFDRIIQLDPADRYTYIIMGLAVFIAILIPALNWN